MANDKAWLANSLTDALGWDLPSVEPVVDAISAAQNQTELEELIQGYLGGGDKIKQLVSKFLGNDKHSTARREPIKLSDPKGRQQKPGQRQAGSVMIKHVPGRQSGNAASSSGPAPPEKEVVNCLSCGKIFFTRADTLDTLQFIRSGGICTFCGAKVALTYSESSQSRPPATQRSAAEASSSLAGSGSARAGLQAAEEEARALKDRLVEYDRDSRRRTTVVDDQNDFFEIDTNAWLDPEEREQLKREEAALQEAEEARKRRVTVTLDLLGRKVVLADEPEPMDAAMRNAEASLAAAKATAAELPQGGGAAVSTALQSARIKASPSALMERPLFVPNTPDSREHRKHLTSDAMKPSVIEEAPQSVVGGWGGEKISGGRGKDRLGRAITEEKPAESKGIPSGAAGYSALVNPQAAVKAARRLKQRNQRKRLQHDDPFDVVEKEALEALHDDASSEGI